MTQPNVRPIVWTIAGSDPGGGAGIQADTQTINRLGAHACSVITALTAQNTMGVSRVEYPSTGMLQAQLEALTSDLPPAAIKLGMLGPAEAIRAIAQCIQALKAKNPNLYLVCDPVMVSTSGHSLLAEEAQQALVQELLPLTDLLTPNLQEAEALTGHVIESPEALQQAAHALLAMGPHSVLLKGGHFMSHGAQGGFSQDYWTNGTHSAWLTSPRQVSRNTHGTGCTLSAAIAACKALGYEELDAMIVAKAYINQGIRLAPDLGAGHGPLAHLDWPETPEDLPWLTETAEAGRNRLQFPNCGDTPLGFYPIVNRTEWLERLLPLGVSTVQLRIKDLTGEALEREIAQATAYAKQYNARLFINDYWELALKYDAYGVHLGQEDMQTVDLHALVQAGIRLGLSTHCYEEVARALAVQPSYMAIGPIFSTTTKVMRFAPQGLAALRRWRKSLPYPLVAIGGIFLDNADAVLATGVDSIAVVRDITQAEDVPVQVQRWLSLFGQNGSLPPADNSSYPLPALEEAAL